MAERAGHWTERDGIGAAMNPDIPDRSLANSVFYERGADIAGAYEWLAELYAPVNAWTVWVPEDDTATAQALEARGHVLDADPSAMLVDLATFEPAVELPDWQPGTVEQMADVNEAAYPWRDGTMARMLRAELSDEAFHLYAVRDDCVLGIHDHGDDAYVTYVATRPEARGRGLASGLLAAALIEARERGLAISTLHATKAGEPVYARIGYERVGTVQMWEHRR